MTPADLEALAAMLVDSGAGSAEIAWVEKKAGGLGIFVRGLVGLEREAAIQAFARFLDGSLFKVDQVRFIELIVDELTKNGVMEPGRLFESPYTDSAPTGPDDFFADSEVELIVKTLDQIKQTAVVDAVA